MSLPATDATLTFRSTGDAGFPFVLFWCVSGSIFAHAATFFLFQVVYPQNVTIPRPTPHVSLLLPDSPENTDLLRWVEAEDPALVATGNAVPPPALAEVRYRPSFATPRTIPLGVPAEKVETVVFPPAVDHPITITPAPPTAVGRSTEPSPTCVRFGGALTHRALARQQDLTLAHRVAVPVHPTILLVGVNAAGEVRHLFLQQSSEDGALDEIAIAHLRRMSFTPDTAAIAWGHATFVWGSDAYPAEKPPSE